VSTAFSFMNWTWSRSVSNSLNFVRIDCYTIFRYDESEKMKDGTRNAYFKLTNNFSLRRLFSTRIKWRICSSWVLLKIRGRQNRLLQIFSRKNVKSGSWVSWKYQVYSIIRKAWLTTHVNRPWSWRRFSTCPLRKYEFDDIYYKGHLWKM